MNQSCILSTRQLSRLESRTQSVLKGSKLKSMLPLFLLGADEEIILSLLVRLTVA